MNASLTFSPARVSLPIYGQVSGWNSLLPPRKLSLSPPIQRRFASIVVGAGFTGLAAARRLAELEPDRSVLLLDATSIGESTAGRNSGFIISTPHNTRMGSHSSPLLVAQSQLRLYASGLQWLENLVVSGGIDCGWSRAGKYHAAATIRGERNLKAMLAQYRDWGLGYIELDKNLLEQRLGTSYYRYGFFCQHNVFVQPAALVRGLADTLPGNVTLLEHVPVHTIDKSGNWHIRTSSGDYQADRVVLANNGFASAFGLLKDRMFTIHTYAALTPRLSDADLQCLGNKNEWGLIPANRLGTTLRRTPDGRLLLRSGYSYGSEQTVQRTLTQLSASLKTRFPRLKFQPFEYVWSGATALTGNGAGYFGQVCPGVYASVGCNGAGVLKGTIMGKLLAELATGHNSALLSDAQSLKTSSWLPPEPIRRIAVGIAIRYQKILAGLES